MNWILIIGIITAMYMAFNIAANDIGNSMGTAVGSGALTMRKASDVRRFIRIFRCLIPG